MSIQTRYLQLEGHLQTFENERMGYVDKLRTIDPSSEDAVGLAKAMINSTGNISKLQTRIYDAQEKVDAAQAHIDAVIVSINDMMGDRRKVVKKQPGCSSHCFG